MLKYEVGTPIICSTSFGGILFGYVKDYSNTTGVGATIVLTKARQILEWNAVIGGYLGLAALGPNNECRLGTVVQEITLHTVTSDIPVEKAAMAAWLKFK